ncbi:MAG TPA: S41 family peptidase [Candidatus Anoxymicrobiaceae bacterium]
MSRTSKIIIGILIGILVVGGLVVAGFAVDKALFKNNAANYSLQDQPVYRETLFNIKSYYFKPYDENKIVAAANAAVAKDKKKGVTNTTKLTNDGINAMVNALGDPHSQYLTAVENKRLNQDLSGVFYGVGFTLKLQNKRPKVVSVIKGSPSDKAGIKAGDVIMSVDGKSTLGESLDSVVLRIRGKQGTKVKIDITRNGKPMSFTITRAKIQIPDFESELQDGKYGVLKLYEFNKGVGQKVRQAVKDLTAKGAQGFILDLRNDPGGLLDEAVQVSSVFIPDGTIVSYQTKGQKKVDMTAQGGVETNKPLVVLINGGSASSSEIVTGALKDRGRATLVGTKSYGKGSVQKVFDMGSGVAVKLTISLYYLPNGESIDGKGIVPNVVVSDKDPAKEETLQNDAAKHVLQNLIEGKPATSWFVEPLLQMAA